MSRRKTGLPSLPVPIGSASEIDVDPARQRERDDQHRRGEVVGAHLRVYPRLEVPVAGEHRGGHQRMLLDGLGDRLGQRAAVADAGGAAVSHDLEPQLLEIGQQSGRLRGSR